MAQKSRLLRPKLSVLPAAQKKLWPELDAVPRQFRLAGGTGLALQLGHRSSIDFDFFAFEAIEPRRLLEELPFLERAEVISLAPNTLNVEVRRGGPVKVSFFGLPRLRAIASPVHVAGSAVRLANLIEIAAFKAAVIPQRIEVKDYQDVAAILQRTDIALADMLAAAAKLFGAQYNPVPTLQALADAGNPALGALSAPVKKVLRTAVLSLDPVSLLADMRKANIKAR